MLTQLLKFFKCKIIKLFFGCPKQATLYNASVMAEPKFKTTMDNASRNFYSWVNDLNVSLMYPKTLIY